jgi:hypothetical protein
MILGYVVGVASRAVEPSKSTIMLAGRDWEVGSLQEVNGYEPGEVGLALERYRFLQLCADSEGCAVVLLRIEVNLETSVPNSYTDGYSHVVFAAYVPG